MICQLCEKLGADLEGLPQSWNFKTTRLSAVDASVWLEANIGVSVTAAEVRCGGRLTKIGDFQTLAIFKTSYIFTRSELRCFLLCSFLQGRWVVSKIKTEYVVNC